MCVYLQEGHGPDKAGGHLHPADVNKSHSSDSKDIAVLKGRDMHDSCLHRTCVLCTCKLNFLCVCMHVQMRTRGNGMPRPLARMVWRTWPTLECLPISSKRYARALPGRAASSERSTSVGTTVTRTLYVAQCCFVGCLLLCVCASAPCSHCHSVCPCVYCSLVCTLHRRLPVLHAKDCIGKRGVIY